MAVSGVKLKVVKLNVVFRLVVTGLIAAALGSRDVQAQTFLAPTHLTCRSTIPFLTVASDGREQKHTAGRVTVRIDRTASLTFGATEKIAKLFPMDGLDEVLFSKQDWAVESDGRKNWVVRRRIPGAEPLVECRAFP